MNWATTTRPATAPMAPPARRRPALHRQAAELLRRPSAPCSSSARSSAGRPPRDHPRVRRRRAGPVLPQRHGARRPCPTPTRTSMSRSRNPGASAADRSVHRLRHPFDFRLEYGRAVINPNAKIVQVDLDGDELGRNRSGVDVGIDGDSGLVLDAAPRAPTSGKERRPRVARRRHPRRRGQAPREDARRDRERPTDPPNPLRVCDESASASARRHRHRRRRRLRRHGRLRAQARVAGSSGWTRARSARSASAPATPWPPSCAPRRPRRAHVRRRLVRPPRHGVRGDGPPGHPGGRIIGNDAGWTQIRRGQVDLYGEQRSSRPRSSTPATRRSSRPRRLRRVGRASPVEDLGPPSTRLRDRQARDVVRQREDRPQRLPQGRHQRVSRAV
jgi:acetolactate synthase-1/2/3 large subunit